MLVSSTNAGLVLAVFHRTTLKEIIMTKFTKKAFNMMHVPTTHAKKAKRFGRLHSCKKVEIISTDRQTFTLVGITGDKAIVAEFSQGNLIEQGTFVQSTASVDNYGNPRWVRAD